MRVVLQYVHLLHMQEMLLQDVDIHIHDIVGNIKLGKIITVEIHGYESVVDVNCMVSVDLHILREGNLWCRMCGVGRERK